MKTKTDQDSFNLWYTWNGDDCGEVKDMCDMAFHAACEIKNSEIEKLNEQLILAKNQEYHPLTNPWRNKYGESLGKIADLNEKIQELEEKITELEEYKFMYEGLGK